MNIIWGILMLAIGAFMFISALTKSEFIIYKLLHARAKGLWGDHAHHFLMFSGVIIALLSSLFFLGIWG